MTGEKAGQARALDVFYGKETLWLDRDWGRDLSSLSKVHCKHMRERGKEGGGQPREKELSGLCDE